MKQISIHSLVRIQAGDPLKAMKALLHTGEQDRILRFATASRSPPVYLLAAQWMQASAAWLTDDNARKQACYQPRAVLKLPADTS